MRLAYPAVLLASVALAACAARDPLVEGRTGIVAGNWRIERAVDRITNAPVPSAFVNTLTVANSRIPFPPPASLQLTCFKGAPIVRVAFQFKVGSTRNAELGYAFDKNPGRAPAVRFVDGWRVVVIEDGAEVARFVQDLSAASSLYVRIIALNAGRTSAEFPVAGAPEAIREAYAQCPVAPPKMADAKAKTAKQAVRATPARPAADDEDDDNADDDAASAPAGGASGGTVSEEAAALKQIMGWFGH